MAITLQIHNRQRGKKLDTSTLWDFATSILPRVLADCAGPHPSSLIELEEVAFYLVGDRRMSQLHAEFSGVPGPTDILTFHHGEVFISVDTAERQAAEFGNSLDRELRIYIVHGLLHLHGHDDHTPAEAAEMHRLQELLVG
jgi:probable rRNA maturation factor